MWLGGKESACPCRRHQRHRFDSWVGKILQMRKWHSIQYSCLENPKHRGAWQATVHRVTKCQTWLNMHVFSSVQSLSCVRLFVTPWIAARQASLSITNFTQTHVHWVCNTIQPSLPLSSPSPPASNPSQHQSLFQWVNSSHEVAKVLEFEHACIQHGNSVFLQTICH